MPLGGAIDQPRAQQLGEQLLRHINDHRARIVVLDLTGVPELDPAAANHLVEIVEASRFIGAEVLVTGLSPRLAQTLVTARIDLARVSLHGDLQGGIEHAETRLNRAGPATWARDRTTR